MKNLLCIICLLMSYILPGYSLSIFSADTVMSAEYERLYNESPGSAFQFLKNKVEEIERSGDSQDLPAAYSLLSQYLVENPESAVANGLLLRVEKAIDGLQDHRSKALAYKLAGAELYNQEDYYAAMESFLPSLELFEEIGDENEASILRYNIGLVYYAVGEHDKALDYLNVATKGFENVKDTTFLRYSYWLVGMNHKESGEYMKAISSYAKEKELIYAMDEYEGLMIVSKRLGSTYLAMEDYSAAEKAYADAVMYANATQNIAYAARVEANLGELYLRIGQLDKALNYLERAVLTAESGVRYEFRTWSYVKYAEALMIDGQREKAIEVYELGLKDLDFDSRENVLELYHQLANAYGVVGDYEKAFEMQKRYSDFFEELQEDPTRDLVITLDTEYRLKQSREAVLEAENQYLSMKAEYDAERRNRVTWFLGGAAFAMMIVVLVLVLQRQTFFQNFLARYKLKS